MDRADEAQGQTAEPSLRARRSAERRGSILGAALSEFSEKGFAAARMEDIARRAGVAKGTIYLHFIDKEALFAGIVRQAIVPVVDQLTRTELEPGETMRAYLERVAMPLVASLAQSPRADVLRLLISEGARFPELAELYFRDVVARGLAKLNGIAKEASSRGELRGDALLRFPQLAMAPALLGIIWSGLFGSIQPLDVQELVRAQLGLLFRDGEP